MEKITRIRFICKDCGGDLGLEPNGTKLYRIENPTAFGFIQKTRRVTKATCSKCGLINDDYFS